MSNQSILKKHHQRLTRLEKDTRDIKLELVETQEIQKTMKEDNEKCTAIQEDRIERIEKSNEQFQQSQEKSADRNEKYYKKIIANQEKSYEVLIKTNSQFKKEIRENTEQFKKEMRENTEQFKKEIQESNKEFKEEQLRLRKELIDSNTQFREEIREHCQSLEANIGNLIDQKMEIHVNNLKYSMLRWGVGISVGILGLAGRVFGIY